MYTINFWPILVAAVVSFGIGALWYSPVLFGKEWMSLTKMSAADMESAKARGMWKAYVAQFVAILVTFLVLGFLTTATNTMTSGDGAFLAFIVWLGFVATDAVSALLWERKPFKLVLISSIGTLVSLVIGGAIIGAWR
jgi:hypothetical protein